MSEDAGKPATQPTVRMKRLYHQLVDRWDEPDDLIIFEGSRASRPSAFDSIHVAIWSSDEACDVETFFSLGMSERVMNGADYRVELHLGRRGTLSRDERTELAEFIANISEYPFMYNLKLGWWERLADPGKIPGFPYCTQVLFTPDLGTEESERFDHFEAPDDDVRILRVIPITARENHILKDHGREAFLNYWEESGVDIWSPREDSLRT